MAVAWSGRGREEGYINMNPVGHSLHVERSGMQEWETVGKEKVASTLVEQLERNARELPDTTAIAFHDRKLTYRELNETVNRFAHGLMVRGMRKGDRVGLMLPRIPELVVGFLAAAKAGGIAVPINFELPVEGIRPVLEQTTPRFLLVAEQYSGHAGSSLPPLHRTSVITTGKCVDGWATWSDVENNADPGNPGLDVRADELVYLNYTSGSTGNSKGAATTHSHIFWNTFASVEALGLTRDDVHLCMFAPFAHPHELFARALYLGGTMVLLENIYPKSLAKAISDNGVTCMMGLAPMYENLLELLEHKKYDLKSLRIPESGGMFTRMDLIERFQEKVGVPIIPVWGSTETTGIALANRPGKGVVTCSTGTPIPSYEVRIVDDFGGELPVGEVGEMIFRGPGVVPGYYRDEENTSTSFRDGWYYSGDLGKRDEHGNFYFVERKTGMMKVAGHKVYPLEIEQVLLDHPGIKEAAVVSSRDRLRGEVPRAIVVPKNGAGLSEKEVLSYCRGRLVHYKLPRIVEIRESLPKIGSGKINKKYLLMERV
jgi:acyl-coenzyme A synthetase/AMP-(fatty) acid ligase